MTVDHKSKKLKSDSDVNPYLSHVELELIPGKTTAAQAEALENSQTNYFTKRNFTEKYKVKDWKISTVLYCTVLYHCIGLHCITVSLYLYALLWLSPRPHETLKLTELA